MKISEILNEKLIKININAKDKTDAINQMIDLAVNSGNIINLEKVKECVFERERLVSTGVGKGFAIPHGRNKGYDCRIRNSFRAYRLRLN